MLDRERLRQWEPYDPTWLVQLAERYSDEYPWLPNALRKCTRASSESDAYIHFISPCNPNQPGSLWQFRENIVLEDNEQGELVLDILEGNEVGGIEFLSKLLEKYSNPQ